MVFFVFWTFGMSSYVPPEVPCLEGIEVDTFFFQTKIAISSHGKIVQIMIICPVDLWFFTKVIQIQNWNQTLIEMT